MIDAARFADVGQPLLKSKKGMALQLGVSARTLDRWIQCGLDVPFHVIRGRRWFNPDEVLAWVGRAGPETK